MAIKILRSGLPVIGYAKIGEPTPKDSPLRGAPYKFDHIELTGIERDQHGRLIPDVDLMQRLLPLANVSTCGGCKRSEELGFEQGLPRTLGIYLPYNDLELNLPHRLAYYRGRTAYCVGDGESAERRAVKGKKKAGGKDVPIFGPAAPHTPCGPDCPEFQNRRCKPNAKLKFVLSIQENVGGCFEFRTTSWNSIANLRESLEMIQLATGGILQWIPLLFEVAPQTVQPMDGGPANTAYIARVTFPGGPQKLLESVHQTLQVRAPLMSQIRRLEAQIERGDWRETPEEIEAVEAEFYTGNGEPAAEGESAQEDVAPSAQGGRAEPSAASEPGEASSTEEPAPEESTEGPSWSAVGEAAPISENKQRILRAKAQQRAATLELEPDAWTTILSDVLAGGGVEGPEQVTDDCYEEATRRLAAYEPPLS